MASEGGRELATGKETGEGCRGSLGTWLPVGWQAPAAASATGCVSSVQELRLTAPPQAPTHEDALRRKVTGPAEAAGWGLGEPKQSSWGVRGRRAQQSRTQNLIFL